MRFDRRTVLGGAVAGTAIGAVAGGSARATSTIVGGGDDARRAIANLEDYADQHRGDWGIPGMIVSLASRDGLSAQIYSGLADLEAETPVGADHLFHVGSITKMMTALTLWSQIDEGKLAPTQTLAELMPEIEVEADAPITLQHLLDHTSGLPRDTSPYLAGGLRTGFTPGSHWAYCNLGYKLAGMIAARTDGTSFPECVERRLLRPLGMNGSEGAIRTKDRMRHAKGYEPERIDRPSMRPGPMAPAAWVDYDGASGCVAATAEDMSRFLRFLIDLSDGKGGQVFSDNAAEAFLANPADAPGGGGRVAYGNGLAHLVSDERKFLQHTGGMVSFTSALLVDREAGVASFASANIHFGTTHRPRNVTRHGCALLRAAQTGGKLPSGPGTKPLVSRPERYVGSFTAEDGEVVSFTEDKGRLEISFRGETSELQRVGSISVCDVALFRDTGVAAVIRDGKVKAIWAGSKEFLRDPSAGYTHSTDAVKALEGTYVGESRWDVPTKIYARGKNLFATGGNYANPLTPLSNGDWVSGDPSKTSDFVRFDGVVNGRPQRMGGSGDDQIRRAEYDADD